MNIIGTAAIWLYGNTVRLFNTIKDWWKNDILGNGNGASSSPGTNGGTANMRNGNDSGESGVSESAD